MAVSHVDHGHIQINLQNLQEEFRKPQRLEQEIEAKLGRKLTTISFDAAAVGVEEKKILESLSRPMRHGL